MLLRFSNGARGVLLASQIEVGESNGLRIPRYGDKGGLVWRRERPNMLTFHTLDGRTEIIHAGGSQLGPGVEAGLRSIGFIATAAASREGAGLYDLPAKKVGAHEDD